MGEYLLLNDGDKLKLGVMDDFRYVSAIQNSRQWLRRPKEETHRL